MRLLRWIVGRGGTGTRGPLEEWRREWQGVAKEPDPSRVASLAAALETLGLPDEDLEIEREMLDGLRQFIDLRETVDRAGVPVLDTGHRVVGTDACHFVACASMPDDAIQPAGRLILTNSRAIFFGGGRTVSLPWHAVGDVGHADRDVILTGRDRSRVYRFRCNTFSDALCGAYLARQITTKPTK